MKRLVLWGASLFWFLYVVLFRWAALGDDHSGDDDGHAEELGPAEGFLADGYGGDEGEDGDGIVEDAGFGGAEVADAVVVAGLGEGGAEEA